MKPRETGSVCLWQAPMYRMKWGPSAQHSFSVIDLCLSWPRSVWGHHSSKPHRRSRETDVEGEEKAAWLARAQLWDVPLPGWAFEPCDAKGWCQQGANYLFLVTVHSKVSRSQQPVKPFLACFCAADGRTESCHCVWANIGAHCRRQYDHHGERHVRPVPHSWECCSACKGSSQNHIKVHVANYGGSGSGGSTPPCTLPTKF